jgi:hypothetical protein
MYKFSYLLPGAIYIYPPFEALVQKGNFIYIFAQWHKYVQAANYPRLQWKARSRRRGLETESGKGDGNLAADGGSAKKMQLSCTQSCLCCLP